MIGKKLFKTHDLVLKVNTTNYDPHKYPLEEWNRFLNVLCSTREYQKEAIITAIHYLISDKYKTIEDLIKENYAQNLNLQERYHSENEYLSKLQLPHKHSACIDLATGTGKSYVMYGIAQIALGLGVVDKVLVLGPPSLTIERELMKKFSTLSTDNRLKDTIPLSAKCSIPSIINADQTIKDYCICIENINAVYANNSSSIFDSLGLGKGSRCLILNDEIHHAFNKVEGNTTDSKNLKKWKEFLLDPSFDFFYILGFTGTAYIENNYFNDVIFRYSLRSSIENNYVKSVSYVIENEDRGENERFQKIYQNHKTNKDKYSKIKPLTILVTKDIKTAKQLKTRLVEFLVEKNEGSIEYLTDEKILLVTSDKSHKANILKLPYVDSKDNLVEWIISVSMLTEGWDVKNVFQIVPMEERAFNSKLLIAQVLGRGLRIPSEYPTRPEVIVFNHDKWSSRIKDLVEEILEMEERIVNSPILYGDRAKYHFSVYNINYTKKAEETPNEETKVFNYKDHIRFLASETFVRERSVKYLRFNDRDYEIKYEIEKEKIPIDYIVDRIYNDFQSRKLEGKVLNLGGDEYTSENLPSKINIENYIRKSMSMVGLTGNFLGKRNSQAVYAAFNTLLRKKPRSIRITNEYNALNEISTKHRDHETVSVLGLNNGSTIFFTSNYEDEIVLEDSLISFKEIKGNLNLPRSAFSNSILGIDINPSVFKTPIDLVFATREPEREFILELIKTNNAVCLTSWFKSKNQSFYSIEYPLTKGSHTDTCNFNPDFFIRIIKADFCYISVVEIKSDNDDSEENKQKYYYAIKHFTELNDRLEENSITQKYLFNFLGPDDYAVYFKYLQDGRLIQGLYKSELDLKLLEK
jgi:type III restriction enzyme